MIELEDLYFEWLLSCIDSNGVSEGATYVCGLLHNCEFHRRVGNDINRAIDGANLRKDFFNQYEQVEFIPIAVDDLMGRECSWLEMLIALSKSLDYIYEGGVDGRFVELLHNMNLAHLLSFTPRRSRTALEFDRSVVETTTRDIDDNRFTRDGHGGIFPLRKKGHPDQRKVELWDQHAAYFNERFEGVLWTSTN